MTRYSNVMEKQIFKDTFKLWKNRREQCIISKEDIDKEKYIFLYVRENTYFIKQVVLYFNYRLTSCSRIGNLRYILKRI